MIALLIIFDVGLTDKEPTYGINGCFGKTKENVPTLVKQRQNFAWVCIDNSYLLVNGKKIRKYHADNKNVNFPTQFCLGSISNGSGAAESREVSLKKCLRFLVDYNVTGNYIKHSLVFNG